MSKKNVLLIVFFTMSICLFFLYDMNYSILLYIIKKRFEKIVSMILVGSAIAMATLAFQSITNNRILTPGILGLDALYIMMQLVSVVFLGSVTSLIMNPYISFIVSTLLMTGFSLMIYRTIFKRSESIYFMVLVGIVLGTFFTSLNGMLQIMLSPDVFNLVIDKLFANFSKVNDAILVFCGGIILLIFILLFKKRYVLDVLSLGKDYSINLGLDYEKEVNYILVLVFILISVSTALVGPITFLGFFAVNIAKNYLSNQKHNHLMVASSLIAVITLVLGQLLVEHVFEFGLPISVLISLIGGSYFIAMLLKENRI